MSQVHFKKVKLNKTQRIPSYHYTLLFVKALLHPTIICETQQIDQNMPTQKPPHGIDLNTCYFSKKDVAVLQQVPKGRQKGNLC